MMKEKLIAWLGLEPGDPLPKLWGWQKFLTKEGKFDWWGFVKQQMLWHPAETDIPIGLVLLAARPQAMAWQAWLLVGAAIFWIRVVHEWIQFKTKEKGTRHLNLLERGCDVLVGGSFGWLYLFGLWMLAKAVLT